MFKGFIMQCVGPSPLQCYFEIRTVCLKFHYFCNFFFLVLPFLIIFHIFLNFAVSWQTKEKACSFSSSQSFFSLIDRSSMLCPTGTTGPYPGRKQTVS